MTFLNEMDTDFGFLPADIGKTKGRELSEKYNSASPFPHIVIDDFLPPALLEKCLAQFPSEIDPDSKMFDRSQERFKAQFSPDRLPTDMRTLFYAFNSLPFVRVLENITGIKGLIPDPYFLGGGFHEISQGGHLSVHADFNHHKLMNLQRRINVLIYLNKDWQDEYGGQLELWDRQMTTKTHSILPLFNRCVIFNTDSYSYHGNPQVISHPQGISRKSIALYYYTATWNAGLRDHTTQFRVRSGTADKTDWRVKVNELMSDLMPPVLYRALRGAKKSTAD